VQIVHCAATVTAYAEVRYSCSEDIPSRNQPPRSTKGVLGAYSGKQKEWVFFMRGVLVEQGAYSAVDEAEAILFAENMPPLMTPDGQPVAVEAESLPQFPESAHRFQQLLGSVALKGSVEPPAAPTEKYNLLEAIHTANTGSKEAEAMLDINIGTAVTEACFKYDHVTKIAMQLNENGELVQFGQTMSEFQFNAIAYRQNRHEKLQAVTRMEALNGHCIEDLARDGRLKDYHYIVSSLVPQDVPEKDLKQEGYFLNTLTFVTQATTENADGAIETQSGFSKGTAASEKASFATRVDRRFDIEAVSRVRQRLGLAPVATTEDALRGILVHKSVLPNGVVDFMRMIDEETAEIAGVPLKSADYYDKLIPKSLEREQSLAGTKQLVKEALLASAPQLRTPMEAVQRIWDLTKEFTVIAAVDNHHIDASIFGQETAHQINETRHFLSIGDAVSAQLALRHAVEVAVISGCGGGAGASGKGFKKGITSKIKNRSESSDEDGEDEVNDTENEDWTWTRGQCRVDACPTRPGKTMVGPCAVCKRCQKMFDKGIDPTKFDAPRTEGLNAAPNWQDALFTKQTVKLELPQTQYKIPKQQDLTVAT
jgi:hypothetical protein